MEHKARKLKVVIVAPSMRVVGGQSIQAKYLHDAFTEDEHIQISFLPNDPETLFQKIKFLRTIFTSLKFWLLLLTKLPKAQVVHIFSSGTTSYLISTLPPLLLAKLFGKKTILHYHTGEAEEHLQNWKLTAKPTMKMFDRIVVPSQFLVDIFARFDLRAESIFNFVDTKKFKFRERKNLRPIFLANRNFESHYNVGCLIRAFAGIQKMYPEARLNIAGFGSLEADLKSLVNELRLNNVSFLGRIENDRMPEIYDEADIYLNSSIVDNMPVSLIEAFSAGIPVVSSNAGGIPYIIEDDKTGLLVEKNDCQGLAEKALSLLQNQEKTQEIISRAREQANQYALEKVRAKWVKLYNEL